MGSFTDFPYGITSFGIPVWGDFIGSVYIVADTASANYKQALKRFGKAYNDDGTPIFCPHTSSSILVTKNGLKTAIDHCVADRGDVVIVMPSTNTYYIDAALALDVKGAKLLCPAGMCGDVGATNAARIQQITAATACLAISGQACEVAGIFWRGVANTSPITIAASSHCCSIHHNFIGITTTTGSATCYGISGAGESTNLDIWKNYITVYSPTAGQTIGGGINLANGTRALIHDNLVTTGGFTQTFGVGINVGSGEQSKITGNTVVENKNNGGSTLSLGIVGTTSSLVADNRVMMTAANIANAISGMHADNAVQNWGSDGAGGNTILA